jgi:hypothetical protein
MYEVNLPAGPYLICSDCLEKLMNVPTMAHLADVECDCVADGCMFCGYSVVVPLKPA